MRIEYSKRVEKEEKDGSIQTVDTEISVEVGPDVNPNPFEAMASPASSLTDDINPLAKLAVDTLEAALKVVK